MKKNTLITYNYEIDIKKNLLYKFILNNNKINYFSTKVWVLKYQKWVIIYHFLYILNSNQKSEEFINSNNFSLLFEFFSKSNHKVKKNFNILKKQSNSISF